MVREVWNSSRKCPISLKITLLDCGALKWKFNFFGVRPLWFWALQLLIIICASIMCIPYPHACCCGWKLYERVELAYYGKNPQWVKDVDGVNAQNFIAGYMCMHTYTISCLCTWSHQSTGQETCLLACHLSRKICELRQKAKYRIHYLRDNDSSNVFLLT